VTYFQRNHRQLARCSVSEPLLSTKNVHAFFFPLSTFPSFSISLVLGHCQRSTKINTLELLSSGALHPRGFRRYFLSSPLFFSRCVFSSAPPPFSSPRRHATFLERGTLFNQPFLIPSLGAQARYSRLAGEWLSLCPSSLSGVPVFFFSFSAMKDESGSVVCAVQTLCGWLAQAMDLAQWRF